MVAFREPVRKSLSRQPIRFVGFGALGGRLRHAVCRSKKTKGKPHADATVALRVGDPPTEPGKRASPAARFPGPAYPAKPPATDPYTAADHQYRCDCQRVVLSSFGPRCEWHAGSRGASGGSGACRRVAPGLRRLLSPGGSVAGADGVASGCAGTRSCSRWRGGGCAWRRSRRGGSSPRAGDATHPVGFYSPLEPADLTGRRPQSAGCFSVRQAPRDGSLNGMRSARLAQRRPHGLVLHSWPAVKPGCYRMTTTAGGIVALASRGHLIGLA